MDTHALERKMPDETLLIWLEALLGLWLLTFGPWRLEVPKMAYCCFLGLFDMVFCFIWHARAGLVGFYLD